MSRRQVHTDGTISLLDLRGEEQFQRPLGRHISVTILSAMVSCRFESLLDSQLIERKHWRSLFMSEEPSKQYLLLESRMEKASPVSSEPAKKLRAFFHGVTKLRARIKNFIDVHTKQRESDRFDIITSYLKVAERLERKMHGWCDILEWQPQKAEPDADSPVMDSAYASSTFFAYNALFLWNRYLVAKVALHAGLLDALQLLPEQQQHQPYDETPVRDLNVAKLKRQHKDALQSTADRFIGILAYAFGDIGPAVSPSESPRDHDHHRKHKARDINIIGALQVFHPLVFFAHLKYISEVQRHAVSKALERMAVEFRAR